MNVTLMKKYADHISDYVTKPSLLLLDRASCHTSKQFIDYIESFLTLEGKQKFKVLLLPAKTAFLISPLDNGTNSAFKNHFYSYDRSTFALKKSAVVRAWADVDNEAIRNFSKSCGLTEELSLLSLQKKFEKNVHGFIPEQLADAVEFFDMWKSGAIKVAGAKLHRGVKLRRPVQPNDSTLDGCQWVEWGK
jgi:hypothetical protein